MESLSFYDVLNAAAFTTLNLGTVAPSSSEDFMLRIINNSSQYTASGVTVSLEGTDDIQLWLSNDGDTFSPTIGVGDVTPGGSSDIFYLRRVTPSTATLGSCTATLVATPASWIDPADHTSSDNVPLDES